VQSAEHQAFSTLLRWRGFASAIPLYSAFAEIRSKKEFKPSAALRKIYHSVERLVVRRKWLESDKLRLMTPRHQILDFPYSRRQAAGYPDEIHPQGVFYCNEIECASCQLKMISDVIRRTPLSSPSSWRWPYARISCASNFRCFLCASSVGWMNGRRLGRRLAICRSPTSPARRCTHNPCAADVGQYLAVL
jgi:hypothetical protein